MPQVLLPVAPSPHLRGPVHSASPGESAPAAPIWPRDWPTRRRLLERQHERIERLLLELIGQDRLAAGSSSPVAPPRDGRGCHRLLRALRIHLRLEERWLGQAGCLCPGQRVQHQLVSFEAQEGFQSAGADSRSRLRVLLALQQWFEQHCDGPDALAYGRASALS